MLIVRIFIWPIAAISYTTIIVSLIHYLTNTWSGAASLGMAFSIFIGAPALFSYAGSIWYRNRMRGVQRIEALVGFIFPVLLVALTSIVIIFGRT